MITLTDGLLEELGKNFIEVIKNESDIVIKASDKYHNLFSLIPSNIVINLYNKELLKYFPNNIVRNNGNLVNIPKKEIFRYERNFNNNNFNLLSKTLRKIYLCNGYLDDVDFFEFVNLEVLDIEFVNKIINLPSTLKNLYINETNVFDFKVLPLGLQKLNIGINEIKNIDYLQNLTNLKNLNISCYDDEFNEEIIFPEHIIKLSLFFENYDKPISYPKKLKVLSVNQLDISNLPNIKVFIGNADFNQRLDNLQNIDELWVSEGFNQSLDFLPNTLKKLTIKNKNYSHDLYNLPLSLEKLVIPKNIKTNFTNVEFIS